MDKWTMSFVKLKEILKTETVRLLFWSLLGSLLPLVVTLLMCNIGLFRYVMQENIRYPTESVEFHFVFAKINAVAVFIAHFALFIISSLKYRRFGYTPLPTLTKVAGFVYIFTMMQYVFMAVGIFSLSGWLSTIFPEQKYIQVIYVLLVAFLFIGFCVFLSIRIYDFTSKQLSELSYFPALFAAFSILFSTVTSYQAHAAIAKYGGNIPVKIAVQAINGECAFPENVKLVLRTSKYVFVRGDADYVREYPLSQICSIEYMASERRRIPSAWFLQEIQP